MEAEFIEKEEVINYHFLAADIRRREVTREKLERALRLGNEFKSKTYITFQTDQGPKRIETTVWTLTDEFIQIKGGVTIPLKSLINIE